MSRKESNAEGSCPYCGQLFQKENLHSVCDVLHCAECGRYFVVKTHLTYTLTTHRVEGEAVKRNHFYAAV
jgi:hypothetical protein